MRVILDANIFISYLLTPTSASAISAIVESAFAKRFVPLVTGRILDELTRRVVTKPYLAQRIDMADVASLTQSLLEVAEIIPDIQEEVPAVSRDRKDDYLLAYALVGRADYLVTGDNDLLTLGEVEGCRIVSPADFASRLRAAE